MSTKVIQSQKGLKKIVLDKKQVILNSDKDKYSPKKEKLIGCSVIKQYGVEICRGKAYVNINNELKEKTYWYKLPAYLIKDNKSIDIETYANKIQCKGGLTNKSPLYNTKELCCVLKEKLSKKIVCQLKTLYDYYCLINDLVRSAEESFKDKDERNHIYKIDDITIKWLGKSNGGNRSIMSDTRHIIYSYSGGRIKCLTENQLGSRKSCNTLLLTKNNEFNYQVARQIGNQFYCVKNLSPNDPKRELFSSIDLINSKNIFI